MSDWRDHYCPSCGRLYRADVSQRYKVPPIGKIGGRSVVLAKCSSSLPCTSFPHTYTSFPKTTPAQPVVVRQPVHEPKTGGYLDPGRDTGRRMDLDDPGPGERGIWRESFPCGRCGRTTRKADSCPHCGPEGWRVAGPMDPLHDRVRSWWRSHFHL